MVKIISFDLDGTLVDSEFTELVWTYGIPKLYAERKAMEFEEAKRRVLEEYRKVGDADPRWYDIKYWFQYLSLDSNWKELLEGFSYAIKPYPEVMEVLKELFGRYNLIINSNAAREFLDLEVGVSQTGGYFIRIFSATSDFGELKKTTRFYSQICRIMGIRPEEMIHVGDHWEFDYIIPRELGIKAFFLDRKGEREGDFVVKDLREFLQRL